MNKENRGYKNIYNKIDRVSGTNHQRDELLPLFSEEGSSLELTFELLSEEELGL